MTDKDFLRQAIALARQSTEQVKCGCVIVLSGKMVAKAYNSQRADNIAVYHAEIKALLQANEKTGKRTLEGATAYCSCEPCVMCLTALALANVARIVFNQTMTEVSGDDPMGKLDSAIFAKQYLNFIPKLERLLL